MKKESKQDSTNLDKLDDNNKQPLMSITRHPEDEEENEQDKTKRNLTKELEDFQGRIGTTLYQQFAFLRTKNIADWRSRTVEALKNVLQDLMGDQLSLHSLKLEDLLTTTDEDSNLAETLNTAQNPPIQINNTEQHMPPSQLNNQQEVTTIHNLHTENEETNLTSDTNDKTDLTNQTTETPET